MKNLVKEFIKSGKTLQNLEEEYSISANYFDNLVCLNYSQIDSPKTNLIVRQCRGIVLDKDTYEIVHYPFFRFFNLDEVYEEREKFNWNNAFGLEKIDGSLFGVFFYNDKWYITTRSQIGGLNKSSVEFITFGDIFDQAIKCSREQFFAKLNKNIDYTFELVSPYNKIVKEYSEPALYLIGARDKDDNFKEIDIRSLENVMPPIVKFPAMYKLIDENGQFIGFEEMKMKANGLENPTDEGFVVVDYSSYNSDFGYYPRIKVKNSSYVALHQLRGTLDNGSISYGGILELIWKNEQDEVLANFKEFKPFFEEVEQKFKNFMENLNLAITKLKKYFDLPIEERNTKEMKKEFAMNVDKRFDSFLFFMFNKGISFREFIEMNCAIHPNYFKKFWESYVSKF